MYSNDTKPSGTFSSDTKPLPEGGISIGNPIGLLLSLTYSVAIEGFDYDSIPSGAYSNDSKP